MKASIKARIEEKRSAMRLDRRKRPYSWVSTGSLSEACQRLLDECKKLREEAGVIYFIRCGEFVKIGSTRGKASKCLAQFKTSSPYEYLLLAEIAGTEVLKKWLHAELSNYHHGGEWFRYEGLLVEFLSAIRGAQPEFRRQRKDMGTASLLREVVRKEMCS